MKPLAFRWLFPVACAGLIACSSSQQPPSPPTFSRPTQMAFACLSVTNSEVLAKPLSKCKDPRDGATNPRIHALVTQSATGEVAAVDLVGGNVLDVRVDIPGYNFVDVGMLPTAIVVPEKASDVTYVGSATGEIGVYSTAAFRPLSGHPAISRLQDPAVRLPGLARPSSMVITPDESALVVASENSGELFVVPICRDASTCEEGTLLNPQPIEFAPLPSTSVPTLGPAGEPYVSVGTCGKYELDLDDDPTWGDAGVPIDDAGAGVGTGQDAGSLGDGGVVAISLARPAALAVERACDGETSCRARLLVADKGQPFIHRFEIRGHALTPLEPWATGVATEALAVTPDVPIALGSAEMTHYVYAVDHQDGSVLVLQDGALLPVNNAIGEYVGRLSFGGQAPGTRALSIAVMTPGEDDKVCQAVGLPTTLRGVFLVVGLSNGRLLVYDIHDYDISGMLDPVVEDMLKATVRPVPNFESCRSCPFVIKRHQLRVNSTFSSYPVGSLIAPVVSSSPNFVMGGRAFSVLDNGASREPRLPQASCIACPEGMAPAFPNPYSTYVPSSTDDMDASASGDQDAGPADSGMTDGGVAEDERCEEGQARICADTDLYTNSVSFWQANYEGVLPHSVGFGYFDAADHFYLAKSMQQSLCGAGVLGSDVLGEQGDQLVIRSAAVEIATKPNGTPYPHCATLQEALRNNLYATAFPITRAFADHVEVDGDTVITSAVTDPDVRGDLPRNLKEMLDCYGGAKAAITLKFEVHARNSFLLYALRGSTIEFDHRVIAEDDGHCAINESASPALNGRLPVAPAKDAGQIYNNGRIALSLFRGEQDLPKDQGVALQINMANAATKLVYDAAYAGSSTVGGVLPQTMHYNAVDQHLYVIDPHLRGLFGLPANDFLLGAVVGPFN